MSRYDRILFAGSFILLLATAGMTTAQSSTASNPTGESPKVASDAPANVLSRDQWRRVDASVNRALRWLVSRQDQNGSFPTLDLGQPGVTSLCVLAFMAHGHGPDDGVYGKRIDRAIEFVLRCQKENGIIALEAPDGPIISRDVDQQLGNCAVYNHAISSLMIAELYGTTKTAHAARMKAAIKKSLDATLEMQQWPKD